MNVPWLVFKINNQSGNNSLISLIDSEQLPVENVVELSVHFSITFDNRIAFFFSIVNNEWIVLINSGNFLISALFFSISGFLVKSFAKFTASLFLIYLFEKKGN